MWLAVAVALAVGVGVGFALARLRQHPAPDSTPAPAPAPVVSDGDRVATLLREAIDHLDVGVVVESSAKTVLFRNAAAHRFQGTYVGVLVDDHLAAVIAETVDGGTASRLVELHGPPRLWLEIAADPIPGGGAVATIRDVTEPMRTGTVRTDFVTNISHELKTPVGALAVLAEALIDESDPVVVQRLLDRLVEEAHRAVRTIDDLLELSQIESTSPADDVVDLNAVVERAVGRGHAVDGGRGVDITTMSAPGPLLMRGDERQLESAVGNLVENAVKYSHEGGVVQVRTRVDGTTVEVMVVDQGIGIPARDLDRVFERFYRVDRARSRETGGTGLGLSIVRHVATNHGGEILVSSQEGEGTTFVLRLPAALVEPSAPSTGETIS